MREADGYDDKGVEIGVSGGVGAPEDGVECDEEAMASSSISSGSTGPD
jgi:hypothetical protein